MGIVSKYEEKRIKALEEDKKANNMFFRRNIRDEKINTEITFTRWAYQGKN